MSNDASQNADPFAPDRWEVSAGEADALAPKATSQPRQRRAGRFLKGPIPWPWLTRAMTLPGKALAIGLMLWHLRGMTRCETVLFCLGRAKAEGIPTTTARRAIRALEGAGLVAVECRPGRGLEVRILDVVEEAGSGANAER